MENNETNNYEESVNELINNSNLDNGFNNTNENNTFHTDINMVSSDANNINTSLTNEIEKNTNNTINNSKQ